MGFEKRLCGLLILLLPACGARGPVASPFELDHAAVVPRTAPLGRGVEPRLAPYPHSEVRFVVNGGGEVFELRGTLYCFFQGNWFRAPRLRGPWSYLEMKRVPRELFCVRGQRPPAAPEGTVQRASGECAFVRQ